ncbi:MAG: transcriptional regulator protein [Methanosarcinaceae archaeon]|nr:transcriptional regulator protein [Methanosarcinaceae archaeon]
MHMKGLNASDNEVIESLKNLGISRNLATTITYLKNVPEASSQEIEMSTGLRQPEVSVAMREMRTNNWIKENSKNITGKGRPTKIYKLAIPIDKIIGHYESKIREENEARLAIVEKLKAISMN